MKTFNKAFYFPLLFLFTIFFTVSSWGALITPFTRVNPDSTKNVQGNYAIAGNTVLCLTEKTNGYGGTCHGMTDYQNITSNMHVSKYLDIDDNSDTWNSTSSYITVPTTFDPDPARGILWAGLFWQGRISNDTGYYMRHGVENAGGGFSLTETGTGSGYTIPAMNTTGAADIKLQVNNGNYTDVTATTFHEFSSSGGVTYAAYTDVTNIVKPAITTDGQHTFTVANLTTNEGREGSPGVFGGWSLVVIYAEDSLGKMRNISIFSGFDSVGSGDIFTIDGFILPKSGAVNSTLSLFAGEGETLYKTDWIRLSDTGVSTDYDEIPDPSNQFDALNIFDGVFTGVTRHKLYESNGVTDKFNDLQVNNVGVDVDTFDVSTLMASYRNANPDLHSMYIQWYSNNDYITPSMLAFATEIYAPKLCYDYSVRQDGHYLDLDRTSPFPRITSYISDSDIEVSVYLRNEEADIAADGVSIKSDVNATVFNVDGNEPLYSSNVNGSILIPRTPHPIYSASCDYNTSLNNQTTDVGCTDNHNIRKGLGSLDALDYIYSKFTLQPNVSGVTDINESLGLTLDYHITVDTTSITYNDYELGSINVPICEQSHSYDPTWGQFNVVRNGQTSANNTNNIYTQISRNPFNASVIFDSDTTTGTNEAPAAGSDVNTTLLVEIIDMDAYGDVNASCANPDSSLSTPIVVTTNFTNSDWMTNLTPQSPNYYNFAVKNAAYRVWYFADSNNSLIENWTAISDTNNTNVTAISGLYDSTVHLVCTAECATDTSATCFNCIRNNYAKPLCSRDNFSVRPESYDLRIYDIDQNNTVSDPSNIDLSTLKGFDPNNVIGVAPTRIDLAADYNYRYDINATGNNGINPVPGYTRYFTDRSDYNVTLYWDPQSTVTCNDPDDALIPFYIGNGTMQNELRNHIQVGQYNLNITDTSWTAVDWRDTSHHSIANGFDSSGGVLTLDCQTGATSTIASGGKYGCIISTNHGTFNGFTYQDHDLEYHPYRFLTTNTVTLGVGDINASSTGFKPFVYMSNLSQSEQMSVHLNTTVTAIGKNSTTPLSNYVTGCYSRPLNFSITKTATTNNSLRYNYMVHNKALNGTIISANDINQTIAAGNVDDNATFATSSLFFQQDQNGTIQLTTNLNYGRDVNVTANPEDINFTTIFVDNNATLFHADLLANKFAEGNVTVNQRVLHYYGKTVAPKIRVVCNTNTCRTGTHTSNNNNIKELISYVVFCDKTTTTCSDNLTTGNLPFGATQVGDIRWYENRNHDKINNTGGWLTLGTDGTIGFIDEVINSGNMSEISRSIPVGTPNYTTEVVIEYGNSQPLPYDAVMQMQSSPWLINHDTNNTATTNEFIIQFTGDGGWSGKHEANATTKTNFSPNTNRRIMW